jgi:uncharacterized membrane protein
MKTALLYVGLILTGLLAVSRPVLFGVVLWLGRPIDGAMIFRQVIYFFTFAIWCHWCWMKLQSRRQSDDPKPAQRQAV